MDTNFIFECSTRYLTSERINNNIKEILAIFRRFLNIFRRFPKIFKILRTVSEVHTNISDHFPRIPEDVRRFPKIAEGCRMFPSNRRRCFDHIEMNLGYSSTIKLGKRDSTYDVIVIFTCEDIKFISTREDTMFSQ